MNTLTTLLSTPSLLVGGGLLVPCLIWSLWRIGKVFGPSIKRLILTLPAIFTPINLLFLMLGPLWLALFFMTIGAAFIGLWQTLQPPAVGTLPGPTGTTGAVPFGFGLGALLAALLGAPFLVWTTLIKQRTLALSETALFNDKLNDAITSLYSRRQVTRAITVEGEDKSEEKILTEWEDDVVQRSAAIDRLEGLVLERPDEAPRVASMLTVYVRELSRQYPAKESDRARWLALVEDQDDSYPQWDETSALYELKLTPDDVTIDALKTWAGGLRPFRTDVEKAVQTLGRLGSIPKLAEAKIVFDLRGANLQGFDLSGLDLVKAMLNGARLEGANLIKARMEGANLNMARMEGANLIGAHVERADLSGARMEGADLYGARMEWANLNRARMEGADLRKARMEGAYLRRARMEGTNLRGARMDVLTNLTAALLGEAAVNSVDFSRLSLSADQVNSTFGDGSTILPKDMPRPTHWPSAELDWRAFQGEWTKWRANPAGYQPPQLETEEAKGASGGPGDKLG